MCIRDMPSQAHAENEPERGGRGCGGCAKDCELLAIEEAHSEMFCTRGHGDDGHVADANPPTNGSNRVEWMEKGMHKRDHHHKQQQQHQKQWNACGFFFLG